MKRLLSLLLVQEFYYLMLSVFLGACFWYSHDSLVGLKIAVYLFLLSQIVIAVTNYKVAAQVWKNR